MSLVEKTSNSSSELLRPMDPFDRLQQDVSFTPEPAWTRPGSKSPVSRGHLFKAYAHALRAHLTSARDLSATDTALFVSCSLQRGVPILQHDAYTNARVYALANAVQDQRGPVLGVGKGSYVEFLKEYVDSVQDTTKTDWAKLKGAEERYKSTKREASLQLELCTYRFNAVSVKDNSMSFDDWIAKHGFDYTDACEERDLAKIDYRRLQKTGFADVMRARDALAQAINPNTNTLGQNMPCSLSDVSGSTSVSTGDAPPTDIVHRPLHILDGFKYIGKQWRDNGLDHKNDPTVMEVDLTEGFRRSWLELGFPQLDETRDRLEQKDIDERHQKMVDAMDGWEMKLSYSDMQSFDVSRGLWNVDNISVLPPLATNASDYLRKPIYVTNRLLLAYNADLMLRLPAAVFETLFPNRTEKAQPERLKWPQSELLQDLLASFPFAKKPMETSDTKGELHIRLDKNNMYPVLLGVLASKVGINQ